MSTAPGMCPASYSGAVRQSTIRVTGLSRCLASPSGVASSSGRANWSAIFYPPHRPAALPRWPPAPHSSIPLLRCGASVAWRRGGSVGHVVALGDGVVPEVGHGGNDADREAGLGLVVGVDAGAPADQAVLRDRA